MTDKEYCLEEVEEARDEGYSEGYSEGYRDGKVEVMNDTEWAIDPVDLLDCINDLKALEDEMWKVTTDVRMSASEKVDELLTFRQRVEGIIEDLEELG